MNARRNFGEMPYQWQDQRTKNCLGFKLTFEDDFVYVHQGGLITLSHDLIKKHGRIIKSKELT